MHALELVLDAFAERLRIAEERHVLGNPFVIDFRNDLLLQLQHRDRAGNLRRAFVGRGVEGDFLRLARLHAQKRHVEAGRHVAFAHRVGTAFRVEDLKGLAVLLRVGNGDLHVVVHLDRTCFDGLVGSEAQRGLAHLLFDFLRVQRERLRRELDRLVGFQLELRLGQNLHGEGELGTAVQRSLGSGRRREGGHDALLLNGERHEELRHARHHERVQVRHAQVLFGLLCVGLALLGLHAHLLQERDGRPVERLLHVGDGRRGLHEETVPHQLLLHYLHAEISFMFVSRHAPCARRFLAERIVLEPGRKTAPDR